jgi:hypothetical protein
MAARLCSRSAHKGEMKKYIAISVVVVILGGWMYLDYSWDEIQIKKWSNTGWVPAAVNDKHVNGDALKKLNNF